jgi:hypothetical protein
MSAKKQSAGVVIESSLSINSNHAAHSTPPPPTVVLFVRVGLSRVFLSKYVGSGAHRVDAENPQVVRNGSEVAFEG